MPNFITRLKRRTSSVASTNQVQTPPQNVPAMVTSPHVRAIHEEPPVDRRIHPDLNSLVADYDPPPRLPAGNVLSSAEVAADLSASSVADFVALQPSTRKQSMPDASIHHSPVPEPLSSTSVPETSSGASPGPSPSSSRKQGLLSRLANLSTGSSSSVPPSISALPPGGWSTFGRGRKETLPAPRDSAEFANSPRITSGSSSLPPSRTTSHSHHTGIETQPQTPTSASHSHSYTTPQSQSHSSHNHTRTTPVSPHTFGNSTPPSSGFTFGSRGHHSPPYIHGQTPPPLPPLNHPAFRLPTSSTFNASRARDVLAALSDEGSLDNAAMQQKVPRLSLSMPSMSQPRHASLTGSTRSTTRIKRMSTRSQSRLRTRTYSKVKAMEIFPVSTSRSSMEIHESTSRRHSRTKSSSSSKISDRRASADFSAIQASALGHSRGDSWEAQVAERIVRMSLGEQGWPEDNAHKRPVADRVRDAEDLTGLGQARGNNSIISGPGSVQGLGSPFLLQQDPHTNNLLDTPVDYNIKADFEPDQRGINKGETADNMSHSHDATTASSSKRKEKEVVGATSRRGGRYRTTSRPRTPSPPLPRLASIPDLGPPASSSLLMPPSLSFTAPTPEASPISPSRQQTTQHQRAATEPQSSVLRLPSPPPIQKTLSGGKRKADDAGVEGGGTPPKDPLRATFAIEPRPHRASERSGTSSHAPSSYQRKRARLSTTPDSRPGSRQENTNAANTGSWSSRRSAGHDTSSQHHSTSQHHPHRAPSRRSLSQASIPISALVSPHAPSVSRSSTFHMRDPRKPAPIQSTPWTLSFPESDEGQRIWELRGWMERGGSPLHAWLFFLGFVIFPLWWVAAFLGVPKTRRLGGNEVEKGVVLDDPQLEHDGQSWRTRCRVMAGVSLLTYIPFIVLIAIFAP